MLSAGRRHVCRAIVVVSTVLALAAAGGCSGASSEPSVNDDASTDPASTSDVATISDAGVDASDDRTLLDEGDGGADASATFVVTSTAFVANGTLPARFTCDAEGVSPPLAWSGAPAGTVEYALVMTTLAKDGPKWNWVLYGVAPTVVSLVEASVGVGTAGLTSDGPNLAYSPPCSQGPGAKTYTFTVHALSASPSLPVDPRAVTGPVLEAAIAPLTLAKSSLSVSYTR